MDNKTASREAPDGAFSPYDRAPCGLVSIDAGLCVVHMNQTLIGWLALDPAGFKGGRPTRPTDFLSLVHPTDPHARDLLASHLALLARGAHCAPLEIDIPGTNDRVFRVEVGTEPVLDAQGKFACASAVVLDATTRSQAEHRVAELKRELEQRVNRRTHQLMAANKDIDVFSHSVSHDLRAPLRHISSFVALTQERLGPAADSQVLQYQSSIAKASKRMGLMIEGLLEYARMGRVSLARQQVPLSPLVHGVVRHLQAEHPARSIEWVIDDDLPQVRGDAILLAEVLRNLLENAVNFTRTRPAARIEIGQWTDSTGERVVFVRDNGVGFDLEHAPNLFALFQRQHHSMDYEGIGTGLALAQRIVERHGGRIWCESASSEGCTFAISLPAQVIDLESEFGRLPA
ncbi:MAG: ATP-binding protein [Hydrogenophaga sp.]|uniref:sensor histidine kinase n=1 Tax=Hydrogenophaga sp. TaxID=1904254 RepID=UPI002ABA12E7|nr:ATP-binding protein [Hydrogenophaga sp.]MDZ4102736.1 ATP-binding protein [Hydrogenophaga sp.]